MIFNISWGFQKNEYFWGYEDLMDTLGGGGGGGGGGHRNLDYFWGSFLCILRSFLRSRYSMGIYFGGLLKF